MHNKYSLCVLCICSISCQTTGSQPLLSLPDTNPNFLKVFITDLSPTVSVNLLYMDLRGNTMNGERMFIDKYLVTVLRLALRVIMKSDKWKQINFNSKALVLIQHHFIQIPTMYAHFQYKLNTPDHYRVNLHSKYLQHLALRTNIVLSKNSHLSMLSHSDV